MRYFDLIGQTLIILVFGTMAVCLAIQNEAPMYAILYGALFLGPWQMFSCFIALVTRMPFFRPRLIHFVTAAIFLLLMVPLAQYSSASISVGAIIVDVPAILAWFYYYITWRWVLIPKRKTGKFLPNVFL